MPELPPATAPAGYIPFHALAYVSSEGETLPVGPNAPLPVTAVLEQAGVMPLSGSISESMIAGPFAPILGRAIWLTLSGEWTGSVEVLRSTDGGTTKHPLTIAGQPWANYKANASEPISEESVSDATYYLDIALASGTLVYEVSQ